MNEHKIRAFQKRVWEHYKLNRRSLPWRKTKDPYKVLVSEIMLQQTQASRVVSKYLDFTTRFPTVELLAGSRFAEVLAEWSGLGYNRRAKYLHQAAGEIITNYGGVVPSNWQALSTLPGVGEATAKAVVVYAFNVPEIFIETNIRRVFIYHFFPEEIGVHDRELLPIVERCMVVSNPREWYWALMDYGAGLPKLVPNPNRQSKHYSKQPPFKGSTRQIRGRLVGLLLSGGKTYREIAEMIPDGATRLAPVLGGLEKEGLIIKRGERYFIA